MDALVTTPNLTVGTDTDWLWPFPAPLRDRGLTGLGARAPVTGDAKVSAQCWTLTRPSSASRPRPSPAGDADTRASLEVRVAQ